MSAVNHVNRVNNVNDVNDVKTPTSAAFGGVLGGRPPAAAFSCSSAFGGGWGVRRLRRRVFLTSLTSLTRLT
jgi:hypothetical protein